MRKGDWLLDLIVSGMMLGCLSLFLYATVIVLWRAPM